MSQTSSRSAEPPATEEDFEEPREAGARSDEARPVPSSEPAAYTVFLLAEFVAFVFYIAISRQMWFYLDEWDFLSNRTAFNLGDLFRAHNEHWVTIPVLTYRALWWVFGLRTYRPYQVAIVLLHLLAALLIRMVMRRVGVRPWTATVVACILVFFGSGYQNIVLPFQMTLVGSLVFGLVQLLLATRDRPDMRAVDRCDYYALAAGAAALMCSGVGVSMVVAVGVAVLLLRGWRLALLHTVPLAVLYFVWFAAIGHSGYTGYHAGIGEVLSFVRTFVAATFGAMGHVTGAGVLLAVLLVGGLILEYWRLDWRELRRRSALPVGLLAGALALLLITAYGRAGLATFQEKSRYLYLVAALILPALGVAADAVMKRYRAISVLVIALLVVGIPGNLNVIINYMHRGIVTNQVAYKQMMLSLPYVPAAKDVPSDIKPEQFLAHFVTIGWLRAGAAAGRIPKPSTISPADEAMDTLRLSFRQSPGGFPRGDVCIGVARQHVFDLATGQQLVVRAPSASIYVTPVNGATYRTYQFPLITPAGSIFTAVRPVTFRTSGAPSVFGRLCAAPEIIRATKAADAAS